jgi:hypothetical protein
MTLLHQQGFIAESARRCLVSLRWREPCLDLVLLSQFHVQTHLFFNVRVKLWAMHQHPKTPSQFAQPIHDDGLF